MFSTRLNSVRRKLVFVVLVTASLALLISGGAMVFYELRNYRQTWVDDLTAQADVMGLAAAPALQFADPQAANDYLSLLKAKPNITGAVIYTANGTKFAGYSATGQEVEFPELPNVDGYRVIDDTLVLFKRIVSNGEILGTVGLRANYDLLGRLLDYLEILGVITVLSLIGAALISRRLQRTITEPIAAVTSVARNVLEQRDFNLRAPKSTNDEIGVLVDAFNDMLNELGQRAATLEQSNRELEHEVRERKRAESAHAAGERRSKTLVAALTQVVWVADGTGHFLEKQGPWSRYTGQSPKDYMHLGWRGAFEKDAQDQLDIAWVQALRASTEFELELRLWHASSGTYRLVSLRAVPVLANNGSVTEWIGAISDIEDERRNEQELRVLNAELEDRVASRTAALETANKELESFSYSVSHDLRAPLRAINGFSDLLWADHKDSLDEEAQRKLSIIRSQGEQMGALIDDLLAFSRLGRKPIDVSQLDMSELARDTFNRLHGDTANGKLEFRLGRLPEVMGDRSLLQQVWINLLSNAIKFSSRKEQPIVEVGAIVEESENVYFVRDNGAGFNPRYQDKLFGVFQRLHSDADFPGTGVGLALAQRIVTKHGGRIWAHSQPDEGATFHFSLPRDAHNA